MTLLPADEGFHAPPDPRPDRWQENFFFICWDPPGGHGFLMHLQRVPGQGFQEAQVVVSVDGQLASTSFESPYLPDSPPPELAMQATVPFREWTLRVDGKGHPGRGPLGFLGIRSGGTERITVDLTLESTLEVADLAQGLTDIVAGLRKDSSGPQMAPQEHYEQGGRWRGRLGIGERQVEAEGLFVRDHSWGVRSEQQRFCAFWTASCLDEGRLFCNAIGIPRQDHVVGVGVVVDESGATFTPEVAARFNPAAGLSAYDGATIDYGTRISRTLHATTTVHIPIYLPHSGPQRYDNNAISLVEMDGHRGFGVMEWADVLGADQAAQLDVERSHQEGP